LASKGDGFLPIGLENAIKSSFYVILQAPYFRGLHF